MHDSTLQCQGDLIQSFFKRTTEPFDDLQWDGVQLLVFLRGRIIEIYAYRDLCEFIDGFAEA